MPDSNKNARDSASDYPSADEGLFALIRERLYTPVVCDVLDGLGYDRQFVPPEIRGITTDMVVVGRAMPVLVSDVLGPQSKPFGRLTEALDQLQPGDVYLARGGTIPAAAWGELLTTAAKVRGAVGAVIDGYHRDTDRVLEADWPVFSRGGYAQDAAVRSSVVDFHVPVRIGQATARSGDLVFGDRDGVVIIPAEVEREAIERALAKASAENLVRDAILGGMSTTEAFARFGVL